jgi:hypothetical protein
MLYADKPYVLTSFAAIGSAAVVLNQVLTWAQEKSTTSLFMSLSLLLRQP